MHSFLGRFSAARRSAFFGSLALLILVSPSFTTAQAIIGSIIPSQGSITGGTTVTLSGSGFSGTTLLLDYQPVTPVSSSDTQIVFKTPVHDNGIALVELTGNGPNAYAEFVFMPPPLASLQPGQITTVMGIGTFTGDGRPATQAMTFAIQGYAVKQDGFYFSEPNNLVIRRVRSDGVIERVAGTGISGYSGDGGPAIQAMLSHPRGMAADAAGNLYFADTLQISAIRKIDVATGIISTVGGGATAGYSGDGGPFNKALLNEPLQIAFDGAGNLYILECGGASVCTAPRIRKVDTSQVISTFAGTGAQGYLGDGGPALNATFNIGPADFGGIAADQSGNVYVADSGNHAVRRIDGQTGIITTFFGNAGPVQGVTTDASGNVYLGVNNIDLTSPRILKLSPSGTLLESWGKGSGFSPDGTAAANAPLCQVQGLALDQNGNILYSEDCSARIRRINLSTGKLETLAGMGPAIIGDPGTPLTTVLNDPGVDILFTSSEDMLTAEGSNYRVRELDTSGNLTDFAGNGFLGGVGSVGGPALNDSMYPVALAQTPNGNVIIDNGNQLLSVDSSGTISPVTSCCSGFSGDGGPATSALVNQVWDVASDSSGNIFFADTNNNRIRRIDSSTGILTTVAGSGPTNPVEGYGDGSTCGDGGPATSACINTPYGIAVASDGTMYIGENGQDIRKVTPSGIISTFYKGTGGRIRLGPGGNLFTGPYRIQPNGHAYRLAFSGGGSGAPGIGDGGAAQGAMGSQGLQDAGVAVDFEGNLYLSDGEHRRIRAVRYGAVIAEPGSTVTKTAGDAQQVAEGSPFATALQVSLQSLDATPANGIRIDFAAPSSGPSCVFPNGNNSASILTGTDGSASIVCTANAQVGSFSVTATPLALGSSVSFSLAATAAPLISLPSGPIDFGTEPLGSTSSPQTVTLTNAGADALTITSMAASGDFSQTNTCGTSLAAGANCTVSITFKPIAAGARTGTLTISDNAAGSPQSVPLTGTGATVAVSSGSPSLSVSPGGTATANLALSAVGGFSGVVNLACSVAYQGTGTPTDTPTCSLNPPQVTVSGSGSVNSTLSVTTTAPTAASSFPGAAPLGGVAFAGLVVLVRVSRRRRHLMVLVAILGALAAFTITACGGGSPSSNPPPPSNPGTTAGSYTISVTATSGTVSASISIPLAVN